MEINDPEKRIEAPGGEMARTEPAALYEQGEPAEQPAKAEDRRSAQKALPTSLGKGWIAVVLFVVALAAMTAAITFVRRSKGEMRGPLPTPPPRDAAEATPAPEPTEPPVSETAPADLPDETPPEETAGGAEAMPTQQAYSRTAIVVDGNTEAIMSSREAAEELILNVQKYFESLGGLPENTITELNNNVSYVNAPDGSETTSYDEAFIRFTGEDTPLRFVSRTTVVEDTVIPHTDTVIVDSLLPKGLRVVRLLGRDGIRRKVFSASYVNGVQVEYGVTEDYTLIEPINGDVRLGGRVYPEDYELKPGFGNDPAAAHLISFAPPVHGQIIKLYGPYDGGFHHGVDIAAPAGTEVCAAADGEVVSVLERGSYGLVIEIQHEHSVTTRYARLGEARVSLGDAVKKGDVIGTVSDEDHITHLHFELRVRGTAYNPLKTVPKSEIEG